MEAWGRQGTPVDVAHFERALGSLSACPATIAYEAARLQDVGLADRRRRRLREAAAIEGPAIHEPELPVDMAAPAGLDQDRLTRDFAGPAVEAFAAD